jgi:hypothetical protein
MTRAFQTQIQSNIFDLVKYICRFVSLIKTRCLLQSIPPELVCCPSSTVMYNKAVGQESAQKFMKQTGDLKAATLYFAS